MFGFNKTAKITINGRTYKVPVEVKACIDAKVDHTIGLYAEKHILTRALIDIADMATPNANATVRRMAARAREAFE